MNLIYKIKSKNMNITKPNNQSYMYYNIATL